MPKSDQPHTYVAKLTFDSVAHALKFTNWAQMNNKEKLFQNDNEIYIAKNAVDDVLKKLAERPMNLHSSSTYMLGTMNKSQPNNSMLNIGKAQQITKAEIEHGTIYSIRQDTRGIV